MSEALDFSAHHCASKYTHPDAGRNDSVNGDENIHDVPPLTKDQEAEKLRVSDKLIDGALTGKNAELIHQGLDCAPDELCAALDFEPVTDIEDLSPMAQQVRLRALNRLHEAWYDGMLGVVAAEAEAIVRGEG